MSFKKITFRLQGQIEPTTIIPRILTSGPLLTHAGASQTQKVAALLTVVKTPSKIK